MATSGPTQLPAYFSNSADFQAWVTGIHNLLSGAGLVQTADTGQIAPASVALPGAINTAAGYEMWKTNDVGQSYAAQQWFFKIEYGTGSPVSLPSLWLTVGSASNGAGTLTGTVGTRRQATSISSKSAGVTLPAYASGDGSRFSLLTNMDSSFGGFTMMLVAERTRNASGSYTSDGIIAMAIGNNTAFQPLAVGVSSSVSSSGAPVVPCQDSGGSGSVERVGANIALGTMVYFIGQPFYGLSMTHIAKTESVLAATFTATVLGAVHTYIALLTSATAYGITSDSNGYCGMLWE